MSSDIVIKIIHKDLKLKQMFQPKLYLLLPKHITERKRNCRKLYEKQLATGKWKFGVTLDEEWVYLSDCNNNKKVKFSIAQLTGMIGGVVVVDVVFADTSKRILQNILESIFEEIPTLYGKDIDKVELHMDKASSHTSKSTAAYLAKKESETEIKHILFDEIRVKSTYASPINFCAFGF
ncbi:uncharacterized protein TNCV_2893941 [Trichonephila clavipes]|nr:uncharacterized protein TNCV_2893941 [Trichonephila clavipes]